MRILYIVTRADETGGAQVHVRDLSTRLVRDGHEAIVAAGSPIAESYRTRLAEAGVRTVEIPSLVRELSPITDLTAVFRTAGLLRELRPDLVSLHSSKAGWIGRVAARLAGIPAVFTAHGWSFTDGVPDRSAAFYRTAERLAGRFADRIVTVSEYDREIALADRIVPEDRIVAIRNGMPDVPAELRADLSRSSASRDAAHETGRPERENGPGTRGTTETTARGADGSAERTAAADRTVRIVMVARFSEQKDHELLLDAAAELGSGPIGGNRWEIDLVGDGPLRDRCEARARELELGDRVRFLGARHDVAEILSGADAYALVTKWEGLPRSIIEAMRAGLPVIASDVGGDRELVEDGGNGFLVPRGDREALVKALRETIGNDERRIAMGARSRERYEREFTFERMYEETTAVYRTLLERRAATTGRKT